MTARASVRAAKAVIVRVAIAAVVAAAAVAVAASAGTAVHDARVEIVDLVPRAIALRAKAAASPNSLRPSSTATTTEPELS